MKSLAEQMIGKVFVLHDEDGNKVGAAKVTESRVKQQRSRRQTPKSAEARMYQRAGIKPRTVA